MGANCGRLLGVGPQALHEPAGHSECGSKARHVFPYVHAYLVTRMRFSVMETIYMEL